MQECIIIGRYFKVGWPIRAVQKFPRASESKHVPRKFGSESEAILVLWVSKMADL